MNPDEDDFDVWSDDPNVQLPPDAEDEEEEVESSYMHFLMNDIKLNVNDIVCIKLGNDEDFSHIGIIFSVNSLRSLVHIMWEDNETTEWSLRASIAQDEHRFLHISFNDL